MTSDTIELGPLTGATWTRTPPAFVQLASDTVAWTSSANGDFWRETAGVPSAHDGNALVAPVADDFDLVVDASGQPTSRYDQFGLFVLGDERRWVKANIELDDTLWLSTVATDGSSDWARERWPVASVRLRAARESGTLRVFVDDHGQWRMIRELMFTGAAAVGVYSCSPKGDGFATLARVEPAPISER